MTRKPRGEYGPDDNLVDFILGITHEIWESKGMDLIAQYYAADVQVFTTDGVIHGVESMVKSSVAMLNAVPDRVLVGDQVIWSEESNGDFYSSHRILSPMTNTGASMFGPATGKRIEVATIADCVVRQGIIVREWLVRDNLALVQQLGFNPLEVAKRTAAMRDAPSRAAVAAEIERLTTSFARDPSNPSSPLHFLHGNPEALAWHLLSNLWYENERDLQTLAKTAYAPYVVLRRSPIELYSGRAHLVNHYESMRNTFGSRQVSLDHVACVSSGEDSFDLAARWTMACEHIGTYAGTEPSGRTIYVLGVTHWRVLHDQVVSEWTLMDPLAILGQILG